MKLATSVKLTPAEERTILAVQYKCRELSRAWNTEQTYIGQITAYLLWLRRNKARVAHLSSERKVELFLQKRVVHDRVGPTARDQAFYALLFLYGPVLGKDLGEIRKIGRVKRQRHLPVMLDPQQVLQVLAAMEDSPTTPFRLIACLLYGCGLRLSEGLKLRIKDVSLTQGRLVLRDTKGRSDRTIAIPCSLLIPLERQIERVRLMHQQDCERGLPVSLPGLDGLRRKYPQIQHAWQWYYLFPQQTPCTNPQAWPGEESKLFRHHQGDWGVQRAVKAAAQKCGLEGVLTPHAFRHAFASHLDLRGEQVTTIQQLLGHKNIETTMIYVHRQQTSTRSPLDDAVERALPPAPRPALALPFVTA